MKCKLCKKAVQRELCNSCRDFLKWTYPQDEPEDIVERYKDEHVRNDYLRRRKRK